MGISLNLMGVDSALMGYMVIISIYSGSWWDEYDCPGVIWHSYGNHGPVGSIIYDDLGFKKYMVINISCFNRGTHGFV